MRSEYSREESEMDRNINLEDEEGTGDSYELFQVLHELENREVEIGSLQIENEHLKVKNMALKEENTKLKQVILRLQGGMCHSRMIAENALKSSMLTKRFGPYLDEDDEKVRFYTGLPTFKLYHGLFKLLEPLLMKEVSKSCCTLFDEFLMVLIKLRLGVPNDDLAYRFNISIPYVSHIFQKWIQNNYECGT